LSTFWTVERVAGSLLMASFIIPLAALIILFASGAVEVFSSVLQGSLGQLAPYAQTFRLLNLLRTVDWIVRLLGFGLLTYHLLHAGEEYLAVLAFLATLLIAAIPGVLHGAFHKTVETWPPRKPRGREMS
jgi:hypothetical protein